MESETQLSPKATKRDTSENLPPVGLTNIINRIEFFVWRSLGEISKRKGRETIERVKRVITLFAGAIEVSDIEQGVVITHLDHLSYLPEGFVKFMVGKGIKIKIGAEDVPSLTGDELYRSQAPRGWGEKKDWSKVPGCWDPRNKTVYAGKGLHGSSSLVLHEFGHGVGDLLGLDDSEVLIKAHKRLYPKLTSYLQQDGPGGVVGRQELFAEGFADYFRLSREKFVKKYDEEFYLFLEGVIINNSTN